MAQRPKDAEAMISTIEIRGLGVIDRAVLEFGEGLTVLTGETGAGKTMVLTSLGLLLGGRADPALVRSGEKRAEVDGVFLADETAKEAALEAGASIDEGELIVSRTLAAQGRSRAHLGGRPVPASLLSEIVSPLISIHGQAEQMRLKSPAAQRELLDAYGGEKHAALMDEYHAAWREAVALKRQLDDLLLHREDRASEMEELSELLGKIDALDLHPGEDEELRLESRRLMGVEDLRSYVGAATAMLSGTENAEGAASLLRQAGERTAQGEGLDHSLEEFHARFQSAIIDVETLADDLRVYLRNLDTDPARLSEIHSRRAQIKNLLEGRASDVTELLAWADEARKRFDELTGSASDPEEVRQTLLKAQERVLEIGARLRKSRLALASALSRKVDAELAGLAMKDAHLEIEVVKARPNPHGLDEVTILLRPHPSTKARPLGQGASGGELSRIMLALEVVLGENSSAHTFIFDEVDSGIGGRTASEVGSRLARLAKNKQVIVVTHLPQVAVFASTHLVVSKTQGLTSVTAVSGSEREAELTRMMGGNPHSEAARRNAIEVLTSAMPQSQG